MRYNPLQKAVEYNKNHRRNRRWHQVVSVMASIVVFCTTYALILPAITMEDLTCTVTEHSHGPECYSEVTEFVCMAEEGEGHQHDDRCFTEVDRLVCMADEAEAHHHDDECYGEDGALICALQESEGHKHEGPCYVKERVLACELPEAPEHYHSDDECYAVGQVLTCGISQHTHDKEKCYARDAEPEPDEDIVEGEPVANEYFCGLAEHIEHAEDCFDAEGSLICELELHAHDESCAVEPEIEEEPVENFMVLLPQGEQIPEGYEADPYTYTDNATFGVTVYHDGTAFPEGAEVYLKADQLLAESEDEAIAEAYAQAEQTLLDEAVEYDGMLAFDIRFEDADGEEVEPASPVYVVINAKGLIPADADAETVAVQHHSEIEKKLLSIIPVGTEIEMDIVADMSEETGTIAAVVEAENEELMDLATMFEVENFSKFTITWIRNNNTVATVNVVCYDADNRTAELPDASLPIGVVENVFENITLGSNYKVDLSEANSSLSINNYTYVGAEIGGQTVTYIYANRVYENRQNVYKYYYDTQTSGTTTVPTINLYYRVNTISITDTIAENGGLTAKLASSLVPEGASVTYTWYKASEPEVNDVDSYSIVSGETEDVISVYGDGHRYYYYVTATVTPTEGEPITYTSASYQVPYYNTLQNGSFEEPADSVMDSVGAYTGACWQGPEETPGLIWQTTGDLSNGHNGRDQDIEIIDPFDSDSHDSAYNITASNNLTIPEGGRYTGVPDGERFAELNCEAWGALYQDVMTVPGSTLYWSFMHRGRYDTDTMQLIIQTADGEMVEAGQTFTAAQGAQTDSEGNIEFKADKTAWVYHSGSYVVPEGQYVTRFYFVSTKATSATEGNFLDKITFSFDIPDPGEQTGNLVITKDVTGIDESVVPGQTFAFKVTGPDGYSETFNLPTPAGQWTHGLVGINPGEYTVIELKDTETVDGTKEVPQAEYGSTSMESVLIKEEVSTDGPSITNGNVESADVSMTVSVVKATQTEVTVTNSYEEVVSNASILKQFVGPDGTTIVPAPAGLDHIEVTLRQYYLKDASQDDVASNREYLSGTYRAVLNDTANEGEFWGSVEGAQPYTRFEVIAEEMHKYNESGECDATCVVMENNSDWVVDSIIWNYAVADVSYTNNTDTDDSDNTFTLSNTAFVLVKVGDGAYNLYMPTAPIEAESDIIAKLKTDVLKNDSAVITMAEPKTLSYGANGQAVITVSMTSGTQYYTGSFSFTEQAEQVSAIKLKNVVKYGTLQLSKEIAHNNGGPVDANAEFTFNIYFPKQAAEGETDKYRYASEDSKPWYGDSKTYPAVFSDGTTGTVAVNVLNSTDAELADYGYYITVTLKHGETITINNLPAGGDVVLKIVENQAPGYSASYTGTGVNGNVVGNTAFTTGFEGELVAVTCINTTGYELPSTGGIGTMIYTISGSVVMGAAALVGGIGLKRRRERGQDE